MGFSGNRKLVYCDVYFVLISKKAKMIKVKILSHAKGDNFLILVKILARTSAKSRLCPVTNLDITGLKIDVLEQACPLLASLKSLILCASLLLRGVVPV